MSTYWKSQQGAGKYSLQFETDDFEKYYLIEKAAQTILDGGRFEYVSLSPFNGNLIWVTDGLYERIASHPDKIIIDSQCQPQLILKVEGWGK